MAEYVQLNMEAMIPELEAMENIKLFTCDEVRRITTKRNEFEYKLQRGTKFKEVLMDYIRYEWDLLVVIKNKPVDRSYNAKKNNIAISVSRHIKNLFTDALHKFAADVKLWLSYIDFCVQLNLYAAISEALEKMLKFHQDKPELFCTAAHTEYNVLNSMDRARMFLLNGIRLHKDSELMYRQAFSMELAYAKTLRDEFLDRGEQVPSDDPILVGHLAELIYESSTMTLRNIQLLSDFFAIVKKYPFALALQTRIYNNITDEFKDNPLRWDIVARYKLENPLEEGSSKDAIQACIKVYEEAVGQLNTEEMWTHYVDAMLELNEDQTYLKNFKTNCLIKAFTGAHNSEKLKEDYYLKWVSQLKGEQEIEKRRLVLKCGTERYPGSVKLWEQYLATLAESATPCPWKSVSDAFNVAIRELEAKNVCALPVWRFIIKYAQLTDPAKAEVLLQRAVHAGGQVSIAIKPMYLEWVVLSKNLKTGRKVYSEIFPLPPFSLELHKKMIEFETFSAATDIQKIRKCYDKMVSQFGEENADVWLDYIKFEQNRGDPNNVSKIYTKAMTSLQTSPAATFMALFSLYKIKIDSEPPPVDQQMDILPNRTSRMSNDENSNDSKTDSNQAI